MLQHSVFRAGAVGCCRGPYKTQIARFIFLAFLILMAFVPQGQAAVSVTLAWDQCAGSGIAGHRLYYGTASRTYTNQTTVGNVTNATVTGLLTGTTYYFAVTAYDTNNLESAYSTEVSYTPTASIAPTIVLTSPAVGAAFTAPGTIALGASVTANGHTITKVQFYNGTALLGETSVLPYGFTWNNVAAGTYSLSAVAVYDTGSTVRSPTVSVSVTNPVVPPAIALTSPASGASFTAPATISVTSSVTPNGHTISKVQFFNGTVLLGETSVLPYGFTWNNVAAGTYSLSAVAVYDTGSTVRSPTVSVSVTNPVVPPAIALTSPANGASFTAPATISVASLVTSNAHTITKVQFFNGTVLLGETSVLPYGFTWNNVAAGTYSLSAVAVYDTGSTVRSPTVSVSVTNPVVPPAIAITSPASGASFTEPATFSVTASVTPNAHTISKVQFYSGSALRGEATTAPYTCTLSNLAAGSYVLTAKALYDATNIVASAAVNVSVVGNVPSTVLPPPWQTADVGGPAVSGAASISGGVYNVSGAGILGGSSDQFRFLYQPMSGKGEIRAQIISEQTTAAGGIAGVMMRETLAPGSEYVFVGVSPAGSVSAQARTVTSSTPSVSSVAGARPPSVWVRLVRSGSTFYAYTSTDGAAWQLVKTTKFSMASSIYFGFAVASGSSTVLNTSSLGNATIIP